jgi:UDP-N-acetylmuramoyl-tripeptide--D-alanyl-D-alanine ligase
VIPLAVAELRALAAGDLRVAPGAERVEGVAMDSRRVRPGDLFVALGGGAAYLDEARARGAAATLVPADEHAAMAALGRAARARLSATVVAITGSSGKTSTKDILAALAAPHARTVAAEGGHNNELGLPFTLTRATADTELVIAEMGMRGFGQIAELCAIARPHIGVITSIGPVHLELVGTVAGVARAKAELVDALPSGGTAVVPAGVPELEPLLRRTDVEHVRLGEDVRLVAFEPPALVADVGGETVELEVPFTQRVQAQNTLAALAAYRAAGLPLDRAGEGAPAIAFSRWRGEERELPGGGLLINDAYNANPDSMRAALAHLAERAGGRRRVAVLGEMAELGPESPRYHRELAAAVAEAGVEVLVAVGELARGYAAGAAEVRHAADAGEAAEALRAVLEPGDAVLVKASRSVGLERVADAVAQVAA